MTSTALETGRKAPQELTAARFEYRQVFRQAVLSLKDPGFPTEGRESLAIYEEISKLVTPVLESIATRPITLPVSLIKLVNNLYDTPRGSKPIYTAERVYFTPNTVRIAVDSDMEKRNGELVSHFRQYSRDPQDKNHSYSHQYIFFGDQVLFDLPALNCHLPYRKVKDEKPLETQEGEIFNVTFSSPLKLSSAEIIGLTDLLRDVPMLGLTIKKLPTELRLAGLSALEAAKVWNDTALHPSRKIVCIFKDPNSGEEIHKTRTPCFHKNGGLDSTQAITDMQRATEVIIREPQRPT
ncbi:MAG: hypothetical protein Q7K55_01895 [Candidatus Levybacteria bacterium]|nr:hypothetical protein [Candidatus Levybacteria bacterium]